MSGGLFHGVQLWINLPSHAKMSNPNYQSLEGDQVKLIASLDGSSLIRVLAGEIDGHVGPGKSFTPITMAHVTLAPGASVSIPWNPLFNALAYSLAGNGRVGEDSAISQSTELRSGGLAVFGHGDRVVITADAHQDSRTPNLEIFLLGGQPIREPVVAYGPFVMNSKAEIIAAMEDYQYGRFGQIPEDALQPFHG
jgi:redox-sensitive bicupin YhaK (pirin superfamily)